MKKSSIDETEYTKDSSTDTFDIEGSLKIDKEIPKCDPKLFIYDIKEELKKEKENQLDISSKIDISKIYFKLEKLGPEIHSFIKYFENIKQIGKGAFGVVVSCYDPVIDKEVAIKVIQI